MKIESGIIFELEDSPSTWEIYPSLPSKWHRKLFHGPNLHICINIKNKETYAIKTIELMYKRYICSKPCEVTFKGFYKHIIAYTRQLS